MTDVGFTGTQIGMTAAQKETFRGILRFLDPTSFHHGDCIGADAEAQGMAAEMDCPTVGHPPDNASKRAFCDDTRSHPTKPYLERNRDIVDSVKVMIATPKGFEEELRSGTWATVRYAKRIGRYVHIIWPDGSTEVVGGPLEDPALDDLFG